MARAFLGFLGVLCFAASLAGCACKALEKDDFCPEGSEAKGEAPPDGREKWCEKEGKRNGPYARWFGEGKKATEGAYSGGEKTGVWKEWSEDGQLRTETEFDFDLKEGLYKRYHLNGEVAAEGEYSGGKEDGPWIRYHKNGRKSEEGDMLEGKKEGKWSFWTPKGKLEKTVIFKQGIEQSSLDGDGAGSAPKLQVVDPVGEGGREDKRCTDGALLFGSPPPSGHKIWCEKGGQKHGTWEQWWEEGNRWIKGQYAHGSKSGEWVEWYDNGHKTSVGSYVQGKEHGVWVYWFANGKKRAEGAFHHGKKTGVWKEWHMDGRQKPDQRFRRR